MISFKNQPFPLLVATPALSVQAMDEVRREALAIWTAGLSAPNTSNATDGSGSSLKSGSGVFLDQLYPTRSNSKIILHTERLIASDIWESATEDWFLKTTLERTNRHTTLLNFYLPGQEYLAHMDAGEISVILTFSESGSSFAGGEITFPDYDLTIPHSDNQVVIFPSIIRHQVLKVHCEPTDNPVRYSVVLLLHYVYNPKNSD